MENTKENDLPATQMFGIFDLIAFPIVLLLNCLNSSVNSNAKGVELILFAILFLVRGILTLMRYRIAWILHLAFSWATAIIIAIFITLFRSSDSEKEFIVTLIISTVILVIFLILPDVRKQFNK